MKAIKYIYFTLTVISCFPLFAQTDQTLEWASYFGGSADPVGDAITHSSGIVPTLDGGVLACGLTTTVSGLVVPPAHQVAMLGGSAGYFVKIGADQNVEYASYFGGEGADDAFDISLLSDGGFVLVGVTRSNTSIATEGAFITEKPEGPCGFVARFNESGQLLWSTYLGGDAPEESIGTNVRKVVVDDDDTIYCVGTTVSSNLPVTSNATQQIHGGNRDGFIAKFNSEGTPLYLSYVGGNGDDNLNSLTVQSNGDLLIGGTTNSTDLTTTSGSYQPTLSGGSDSFVMRIDSNGQIVWSTFFGGDQDDELYGSLATDEDGNIFTLLGTKSPNLETLGASFADIGYDELRLVSKFTDDGQLVWSRYLPYFPIVSPSGLNYCGETVVVYGAARPGYSAMAIGNSYQPEINALVDRSDIFLQGINGLGEPIWGTYYGGSQFDIARSVKCLAGNRVLLCGSTRSGDIEITGNAFQSALSSDSNALFAIFEIDGLTNVEHNEELKLKAYPNPTTQHIWLDLPPSFAFHAEVSVYNSVGQLVQRHTQFSSHEPLSLQHPPGLYIVEARKGDNAVRAKVVVR